MSYLRPINLQPKSLRLGALDAWLKHVFHMIQDHYILSMRVAVKSPSFEDIYVEHRAYEDNFVGNNLLVRLRGNLDQTSQALHAYLNTFLPPTVQEEAFHRGAQTLRKDEFHTYDMFPHFLRLFWRPDFKLLSLPYVAEVDDRLDILNHLHVMATKLPHFHTQSAKFRLIDADGSLSLAESYLVQSLLRRFRLLKVLVLWRVADDSMLQIIGENCHLLETLDLWRSSAVTDHGLERLLAVRSGCASSSSSPLCQSLLRVVIKETSVTHKGSVLLIVHCSSLERLDFSHGVVVKEFLEAIRHLYLKNQKTFSLKTLFLPVTNAQVLLDVVNAFPLLEDLRLWTSLPGTRGLSATDFPHLHSLMLGGLHSDHLLRDLVLIMGKQLTSLKLETVLTPVPLDVIGANCPNLSELQVINAKLSVSNHVCRKEGIFSKLKLVYFFLVEYEPQQSAECAPTALHCVLSHARHLECLQATGSTLFNDQSLEYILTSPHVFPNLKRFILSANLALEESHDMFDLSAASVLRLFKNCPLLQCVGDLRHWDISAEDLKKVFCTIQTRDGARWLMNHVSFETTSSTSSATLIANNNPAAIPVV